MRNPNESKYFDEKLGCTLNTDCPVCKKRIYSRDGIYAVYHTKVLLHNTKNLVMSVYDSILGSTCPECFYEMHPKETMPDDCRSYYE